MPVSVVPASDPAIEFRSDVSVELVRVSRHHDGVGHWGDQVVPMIRGSDAPDGTAGGS